MASSADGFYLAPDGEDLVRIYRHIADVIPCPPTEYWAGGDVGIKPRDVRTFPVALWLAIVGCSAHA